MGENSMIRRLSWYALLGIPAAVFALGALGAVTRGAAPEKTSAIPAAHFHHLHLNTLDPAAAIDFYTSKFDCEKAKFAGVMNGVWAQKSWILFNKVKDPPPWELTSAIWHFGWGAEDMKTAYQKQLDMGTKFFTPITQIKRIGSFYYAYVESPDHALIEINTAKHHHFGHLHLLSEDPVSAGLWYMKHFGAINTRKTPPSRKPDSYEGIQVAPNMSLMMDNVNIIIFPVQYSKQAYPDHWKGRTEMTPTKGRVVDHVGFSFDNLPVALERLKNDGVKVTQPIRSVLGGKIKFAFIEGPDKINIELVEGHAKKE
jgi:catechol 2,3-dioxygenase-like lactoylglutathione lyase family enzyme